MFPLADIVRRQHKLVLPVFVRPSFERHEVDKRRYDHAVDVAAQFDEARIRLIEILNDRAYSDRDPQPQSVVWERMNLPIARGLRGLIYVLWDLSQVDPSDLSILLAGDGRMRIGFGEIDPPGEEPADAQIREAVALLAQPVLHLQQAGWNIARLHPGRLVEFADAKIKSGIAALAPASTSPTTRCTRARFRRRGPGGSPRSSRSTRASTSHSTSNWSLETPGRLPNWACKRVPIEAAVWPRADSGR